MVPRRLIECVPNVSEGRRGEVIEAIAEAVRAVPGAVLLDVDADADHHRAVFTFAGEPEPVARAALALTEEALKLIDLRVHRGEHPRMGAVDVIPFVPLRGVTMDECVALARRVGRTIAERHRLPVYLYEASATRPERRDLAGIRRGGFEGFPEKIQDPKWAPDFGPARVHPSAGVVAVGARPPLVAFNVNLGTDNLEVAKEIAKAVRHSSGGLRYVKALGVRLEDRGIVQVSMNMTDYERTPLHRALELIRREAARYGVPVIGTEIVGLVPQRALFEATAYYLQLENFSEGLVLEERLARALELEEERAES